MAENAKDTKKQAALREQIEHHPIWNYPPEERLQHNREWQQLYLLVFQFKEILFQDREPAGKHRYKRHAAG